MDEVEVAELPFLKGIFQAMYFKDVVKLRQGLEAMIAARAISERSWRRLVEVAAELDSAAATRVLLEQGLPPAFCNNAVAIAARNNHAETLSTLVNAGAPVNDDEDFLRPSALYSALLCGWTEPGQAASILLDAGAYVNPRSASVAKRSRFVPLAAASRRLAPSMVRHMLELGADPTIGSQPEDMAIFRALYAEDQPMFPFSVRARAPFEYDAVRQVEVVRLLAGALFARGDTTWVEDAFRFVVDHGRYQLCELLLSAGVPLYSYIDRDEAGARRVSPLRMCARRMRYGEERQAQRDAQEMMQPEYVLADFVEVGRVLIRFGENPRAVAGPGATYHRDDDGSSADSMLQVEIEAASRRSLALHASGDPAAKALVDRMHVLEEARRRWDAAWRETTAAAAAAGGGAAASGTK